MQCPACQRDNPDAATFCAYCGVRMAPERAGAVPPPVPYPDPATLEARRGPGTAVVLAVAGGCAVISVAIMAAILFPVFASARQKARSVACLSNAKQIELGILMYTQDYDQKMPRSSDWCDVLQPYLKSRQLFSCPMRPIATGGGSSYGMNRACSALPMQDVPAPSMVVLLYDAAGGLWNQAGAEADAEARHNGACTLGFCDGHVTQRRLVPGATMAVWDPLRTGRE